MTRMTADCRTMPSESHCSLVISGEEDEVLRAAVAHAVDVHGHTDDEELRSAIRAGLTETPQLGLEHGAFVQTIAFRTNRIDEVIALENEWGEAMGGETTARWGALNADRDNPGRYVQIVAFPNYEEAMRNSKHPVTTSFAERMMALCEGEAEFTNLDVKTVDDYVRPA